MPRFAANLSTMYGEWPFPERFAAAAADGFAAVECQFPYDWPAAELAQRLRDAGLQQVLINAPPGDAAAGERGLAALPGREADFRRGLVEQALPYAQALGCPRVHVMAGLLPAGGERAAMQETFVANLAWAAAQAAGAGVELLIEPINPRDVPGYFLNRQDHAHEIVALVGAANLAVQMDLYHCQIVEGDLSHKLRRYFTPSQGNAGTPPVSLPPTGGGQGAARPSGASVPTRVGHLQIAGVPDRHEPDAGELAYGHLFRLIDELGWAGWVGAEYRPRGPTRAGLGWFAPYRVG